MKKINIAIIGLLFASISSSANVLPNDFYIKRCVKIVNINEFPNIVVIGYYPVNRTGSFVKKYVVNQDSCLTKGNKFNRFYLLWTTKSYFDSTGIFDPQYEKVIQDFGGEKTTPDSPIHLLSNEIELNGKDTLKLVSEELSYKLYMSSADISLYLSRKISHFIDNTEKTMTFPQPGTVERPQSKENH